MAFSLAGAAALTATASAQQSTVVRPWPTAAPYNAQVSPWPSYGNPAATIQPPAPAPFTPPVGSTALPAFVAPPASRSMTGEVAAGAKPVRTLYYKKDTNAPVKRSMAADLAAPIVQVQARTPGAPSGPRPAPPPVATQLLSPASEQLFHLDTEQQFIARENATRKRNREDPTIPKDVKDRMNLDPIPGLPMHAAYKGPFAPRHLAPMQVIVEPNYVLYRRLLFEDRNTERYGWTLGPLQPFASAYKWWGDMNSLPYKLFSFPCLRYDTSAGLCLPGDPVPQMLYPPELSLTGALAQAGVTVALYAIIP